MKRPNAWYGRIECLGGEDVIVVASTKTHAENALMAAWKQYDKDRGSDYHDRVRSFDDLTEIYGAFVKCMPWNQWCWEKL